MISSIQPSFAIAMENSNKLELAVNIRKFQTDLLKRMILLSLILQKFNAAYQSIIDDDFDDDDEEEDFDDEFDDEFEDEFEDEIIDDDEDEFDDEFEDDEEEDF
jgi:hypothetical protein